MTFVSYAQNCEDVLLWRALKTVERGFYIDVGAAWPTFHSVTRAFYERGWSGINVEPNPRLLGELNRERPRDLNLGVAVGRESGEINISVMSNEGLSTVVDKIAKDHVSKGFTQTSVTVPMTTLAAICAAHVEVGQPIHFLKVDVEGFEAAALSGNDWARFRPWIVVVEAMEPMCQVENHHEWEEIIVAAGYSYVQTDGLNRYYVADEHADLAPSFRYPASIFDQYMTVDMQQAHIAAAALESQVSEARREIEVLRHQIGVQQQQMDIIAERKAELDRYRTERSSVETLLFDADGCPRRLVRQLFFHADGRCRPLLRRGVFHRKGQPRAFFRQWLQSEQYRSLPRADTI